MLLLERIHARRLKQIHQVAPCGVGCALGRIILHNQCAVRARQLTSSERHSSVAMLP
jgi:hypothetical protein